MDVDDVLERLDPGQHWYDRRCLARDTGLDRLAAQFVDPQEAAIECQEARADGVGEGREEAIKEACAIARTYGTVGEEVAADIEENVT